MICNKGKAFNYGQMDRSMKVNSKEEKEMEKENIRCFQELITRVNGNKGN